MKRIPMIRQAFCSSTSQIQLHSTNKLEDIKRLFMSTNEYSDHFWTYVTSYDNSFWFTSLAFKMIKSLVNATTGYTSKPKDKSITTLRIYYLTMMNRDTYNSAFTILITRLKLLAYMSPIARKCDQTHDRISVNPCAQFFRTLKELNVNEHTRIII